MRRILHTSANGGVTVTHVSPQFMRFMTCGGGWKTGRSEAEEIHHQCLAGHNSDVSARFVRAAMRGGLAEYEAYCVIRDRDCAAGLAHDVIDARDLPDRWFRNAWRRSSNGGPVWVDDDAAKRIQWRKILDAVDCENKRRARDLCDPLNVNLEIYKSAIEGAHRLSEIRRIWPDDIRQL